MTADIGAMCAGHLEDEERLLRAALPLVHALQAALASNRPVALPDAVAQHEEIARLIDRMKARRQRLIDDLGRRTCAPSGHLRLSQIIDTLPAETRGGLQEQLDRVRGMAEDLLTLNHALSVHVRIHVDAYQRLLRDLTGTANSSGRYGASGQTEASQYRSLLQIDG